MAEAGSWYSEHGDGRGREGSPGRPAGLDTRNPVREASTTVLPKAKLRPFRTETLWWTSGGNGPKPPAATSSEALPSPGPLPPPHPSRTCPQESTDAKGSRKKPKLTYRCLMYVNMEPKRQNVFLNNHYN